MIGIYKITSPSSKVYIGQSWDINKRKKDHRNSKEKTHLANSIKKHGFENHLFEVVHELPNDVEQNILDTYEQLYIDSYRDCGIVLMNLREGGSRGKHSDESRAKHSRSMQGVGKGRKQSKEWINKRASTQVGNKNWLGKSHSHETKKKMRMAAIGKPKFYNRIQVVQLSLDGEFIKEWSSAKEAGISLNVFRQNIANVCKGHYSQTGGFKWMYKSVYQSINN